MEQVKEGGGMCLKAQLSRGFKRQSDLERKVGRQEVRGREGRGLTARGRREVGGGGEGGGRCVGLLT